MQQKVHLDFRSQIIFVLIFILFSKNNFRSYSILVLKIIFVFIFVLVNDKKINFVLILVLVHENITGTDSFLIVSRNKASACTSACTDCIA